jgi:hypothetical protein
MKQFVIEGPVLDQWLRTSFLDDRGRVFLPCGAFGDEIQAVLCLAHDGMSTIQHEGHVYAPASWLAKEHPRYARAIETIVARIIANERNTNVADTAVT